MTESLKMSKHEERVVDAGITALHQWTEDTNDAAIVDDEIGKTCCAMRARGSATCGGSRSSTPFER